MAIHLTVTRQFLARCEPTRRFHTIRENVASSLWVRDQYRQFPDLGGACYVPIDLSAWMPSANIVSNFQPWATSRQKGRVNSCFLSCKTIRRQVSDGNGNLVWKNAACPGGKPSWRASPSSFAHKLSSSIGPQKLARLIFWFAQKSNLKTLKVNTGIGKHSLSNAVLWVRHAILVYMLELQSAEVLGGGRENPDVVVLIDETHMTRKKTSRGGFQGRTTSGHNSDCWYLRT